MVGIATDRIDVAAAYRRLGSPASGGLCVFLGTVRNVSEGHPVEELEYTAYVPMAERLMREIEEEIRSRWDVHEVVMIHRIGTLPVGEIAVLTGVSSTHRKECFEACRHAIDRIKADVPIWKKEIVMENAERKMGDGKLGSGRGSEGAA